jgi:xanthine dehydrogenase YagR molybdenum-binding subunit
MADYSWPDISKRSLIGRSISRLDGPVKVSGEAKYSYDVNRPGMLFGGILRCPYAHARITRLDVSRARSMPAVKAVRVIQDKGSEIKWEMDEIVGVAATSEAALQDALGAIEIDFEVLSHFVNEEQKENAPQVNPGEAQTTGDPDQALAHADAVVEGYYGLAKIAHCCLEPHGQVCEWEDDEHLTAWCSTQNVSGLPPQFAEGLGIPAANVRILTPYMGGGFGSKFGVDRWGVECAQLAREAKAPVKMMLHRDAEIAVAGDRPSAFAKVKIGCTKEGELTAWESESWGTGGVSRAGNPPLPYVVQVPNMKRLHIAVPTNTASARAWRAPNHPQACLITMAAIEDAAAHIGMDPLELMMRNIHLTGRLAGVYKQELSIGAKMIGWSEKWHPRGEAGPGPIKRGLGLGIHTWGGRGHNSNCEVIVYPDGGVEARLGSQDLGTGTRTIIALVLAETFGLGIDEVKVSIGDSRYPQSGPSGGSTTVGGVGGSTRRAAVGALDKVLAAAAPALGVESADDLEAWRGFIRVKDDPSRSLEWKRAAARIGPNPLTSSGRNPGPGGLTNSGVGGIQMADVAVDTETGVVRIKKIVAVQDCGLILDMKTTRSQVFGGLIQGIAYALMEEKIMDPVSGRLLNPDMEFYKLPGLFDVGKMEVHMMTGPGYDERGVIGVGEPPVIAPGAAISNAVANAIGVRVPTLPLTPDRVLDALGKGA